MALIKGDLKILLFLGFFVVVQNEDMKGFARSSHTHTCFLSLNIRSLLPQLCKREVVAALAARGVLPYLRGDAGSFSYVNSLDAAVN